MRIGYDAKRAAANFTGLGNYSRYIIKNITELRSDDIILYTPRTSENGEYRSLFVSDRIKERTPVSFLCRKISSLWRSFFEVAQIRRDNIELFHGLSNELPFSIARSKAASVVTIHDLIFRRLPHCYKPIDRFIYNIKFRYACRNADRVIAISECTKRDIVEFYGIDPQRISVVYQSCSHIFKQDTTEEQKESVRVKYNLPSKFILNVGTLEERKNLFLIVKSLVRLPKDVHLVAVGRRTPYSDMVKEYARIHGVEERLHMIHKMKYEDLPVVYRCADLFAYPSHYEGFGIPVIEAINSSLAVIAATGSCLEEAGGGGAVYIDPYSEDEFVAAAVRLLGDAEYRESIIKCGREYILRFDDKILAQQMYGIYQQTVR